MKKSLILIVCICLSANFGFAQFKEYEKMTGYFAEKKYQQCIDYALKLIEKEPKELNPVLYCAKSFFELYKTADEKGKLSFLKNSLKYSAKIEKIDKNKDNTDAYAAFLEELHIASLEYAAKLYESPQKEKSQPIFDYLVKIYRDTTEQYYVFNPSQRKKTVSDVGLNVKKEKVNQVDSKGLKQGLWTKVYPNGSKAYEVNFKDNIPVGEYKRYHENGKLAIFLNYDDKGEWADAKIYNDKAELIAEGQYHRKLKHGHWTYYKDNIKAAEDNYVEGKREGTSKIFYKSGKVSDERIFTSDVENGVWRQYFPSGKLKLETRIDKGVRNSVYYVYYENGNFETKGRYKNDQMDGEWVYYDEMGKEMQKIKYVMGKAQNQTELDEQENKIFLEFEKNKTRLVDPENYKSNPEEYLKESGLK